MLLKEFLRELNGKRIEGELIKTFFYSLLSAVATLAILYFTILRNVEDLIPKYGFYLFFAVISYAIVIPLFRHVRAYKELMCMPGMMVGMGTGMVASFLIGFYVASTNGMFIGSLLGMAVGIGFGFVNGKCCGIMGVLEGIMAGFMGGLMGAMTAFMLFNDHLQAAAVIVFAICGVIVLGLHYMVYKEMKLTGSERNVVENQILNIVLTSILVAITTWIMVFGPRSALFS